MGKCKIICICLSVSFKLTMSNLCPFLWLLALTPSAPLALMPPPSSGGSQASTVSRLQMQLHLHDLQQNATDLRKQLAQLRKMQVRRYYLVHLDTQQVIEHAWHDKAACDKSHLSSMLIWVFLLTMGDHQKRSMSGQFVTCLVSIFNTSH